jgi:transposase
MPEIARFTAEQTARYFAGGELGKPEYTDPEVRRKMDVQQARLRAALDASVDIYADALAELSPQTEARLYELHRAAGTDPQAGHLLLTMLQELGVQALRR